MFTINTADEFLKHEVMVWGEDEVDSFLADGFMPAFVGNKWTWIDSKNFSPNPQRRISHLSLVAA
jgi:hypothetical protein